MMGATPVGFTRRPGQLRRGVLSMETEEQYGSDTYDSSQDQSGGGYEDTGYRILVTAR